MLYLASEYWGIHVFAEICMPHAIQIRQTGGPEVLDWPVADAGEPATAIFTSQSREVGEVAAEPGLERRCRGRLTGRGQDHRVPTWPARALERQRLVNRTTRGRSMPTTSSLGCQRCPPTSPFYRSGESLLF